MAIPRNTLAQLLSTAALLAVPQQLWAQATKPGNAAGASEADAATPPSAEQPPTGSATAGPGSPEPSQQPDAATADPGAAPTQQPPAADPTPAPPPAPAPANYPPGPYFAPGTAPPAHTEPALPPPPPPAKGVHLHDGFFLQMGFGLGAGLFEVPDLNNSSSTNKTKGRGLAGGIELLLGGTPVPGLILGAGLVSHSVTSPTLETQGVESETNEDTSLALGSLSVFSSYYFDPSSNFFVHGGFGLGSGTWTADGVELAKPSGLALMAGVGYGGWVGDNWALSGLLRASYYRLVDEDSVTSTERDYRLFAPTLSFIATFN